MKILNIKITYKQKKMIFLLLFFILFIALKIVVKNEKEYFFSFYSWDYLLIIFICICLYNIKNIYNFINVFLFLMWLLVGNYGAYNGYLIWTSHLIINTKIANNIYLIYLFCFALAIIISESFFSKKSKNVCLKDNYRNNYYLEILCILYPILNILEVFFRLHYIPLLSGEDITGYMYQVNMGILSKYGFINVLCGIYLFYLIINFKKIKYTPFFLIACFASVLDGTRFKLLIIIISVLILVIKTNKINTKKIVTILIATFFIYSSISAIRANSSSIKYDSLNTIKTTGVEYRDWSQSLQFLNGRKLDNYNWLGSSLISLIGNSVSKVIFRNYDLLINNGSASYFKKFFNAVNGIRIGIIGEIHYAYEYLGLLIFFIFGIFSGYINYSISKSTDLISLAFKCIIFSLNILTIMGQSDVYFGSLKSLFNIYLLYYVINFTLNSYRRKIYILEEGGA